MWSAVASVSAATVDFATFPSSPWTRAVGFSHGLLAETRGGTIVVYGPGGTIPGACPQSGSRVCRGELTLIFFAPVRNLSFTLDPGVPPSTVTVTLFDGETVVAQGAVGGTAGAVALSNAQVTRARLNFGGIPASARGGSLRGVSFDTDAPALAGFAPLTPTSPVTVRPRQPEVLDFARATVPNARPRSIRIPGATVTLVNGDELYLYNGSNFMPAPGGFCALDGGFRCLGDAMIVFDQLIQDLSFETYFYKPGDQVLVRLFSGDVVLTERTVAYAGLVSFFGFAGISHIVLIDQSRFDTGGLAYGNFRYALYDPTPPPPPIPLPASAAGLLAGLAALAAAGARRNRRKNG
jgi:MYXO-CTERM domain-containing protein